MPKQKLLGYAYAAVFYVGYKPHYRYKPDAYIYFFPTKEEAVVEQTRLWESHYKHDHGSRQNIDTTIEHLPIKTPRTRWRKTPWGEWANARYEGNGRLIKKLASKN